LGRPVVIHDHFIIVRRDGDIVGADLFVVASIEDTAGDHIHRTIVLGPVSDLAFQLSPYAPVETRFLGRHVGKVKTSAHGPAGIGHVTGRGQVSPVVTGPLIIRQAGRACLHLRVPPEIIRTVVTAVRLGCRQLVGHPFGLLVLFIIRKGISPLIDDLPGTGGGEIVDVLRKNLDAQKDEHKKTQIPHKAYIFVIGFAC